MQYRWGVFKRGVLKRSNLGNPDVRVRVVRVAVCRQRCPGIGIGGPQVQRGSRVLLELCKHTTCTHTYMHA